jgi:hypothetical protein
VAYILCEELNMRGTRPAYQFAATLIGSLLGRTMPPGEVKKLFVGVQREAEAHATAVAHALLEHKLKKEWSSKQFRPWLKGVFGEGLPATAEMPPIIEHGQVNDQWLQALLNTRRAILRRVNTYGPLGGHRPLVWVASESRILTRLPLGNPPGPGGTIHFGKALEVPTPSLPFQGGTTPITFPQRWLDSPPSAAVLYAVPAYWHQWQALFVARPKKMELGERPGEGRS